jgi:pyruvate formate lyase activating enzyme
MIFNGFQKMTLLDFPGRVACTLFAGGCNFRCPFCHNAGLVLGGVTESYSEDEILDYLSKRKGLLDGVCITGGEPTLRKDLPDFIRRIKDMGYLVKLDTNGSNPRMLKALLEENLLDYVAMDIKNCPDRYAATCGGPDILTHVEECLDLLRKSPVEWELRTTCVKPFHDRDAMEAIGKWLRGTEHYYLQAFVDSGDLVGSGISGFTKEEMEALCQAVLPYIPTTRLRGI